MGYQLTEAQCEQSFREVMADCNYTLGNDEIMDREEYSNYTDSLCKDGMISEDLYNSMDNPF